MLRPVRSAPSHALRWIGFGVLCLFIHAPPLYGQESGPCPVDDVMKAEKLDVYQPAGRFSPAEVKTAVWFLFGACIGGLLLFAIGVLIFRDNPSRKSRSGPSLSKIRAPGEERRTPREEKPRERYNLDDIGQND